MMMGETRLWLYTPGNHDGFFSETSISTLGNWRAACDRTRSRARGCTICGGRAPKHDARVVRSVRTGSIRTISPRWEPCSGLLVCFGGAERSRPTLCRRRVAQRRRLALGMWSPTIHFPHNVSSDSRFLSAVAFGSIVTSLGVHSW